MLTWEYPYMQFSMVQLSKVQSEGDAYKLIEDVRWGDTPECPHCGATERMSFLTPADGVARKTRTGKPTERRLWFCGACRKQSTVLVGTIFQGTKVPIRTWLFVFYEMCANKNGIAAREIQRRYEVTSKTAWFMTQRIREAMKREPLSHSMSGVVIADETWVGGVKRNRHTSVRQSEQEPRRIVPGELGTSHGGKRKVQPKNTGDSKTIVLSLIEQDTGEVRSAVVPDVYSTRKMTDSARTERLFGQVAGRRLTYRPLTGR